jgi:hypothetical protein
LKEEYRVNAASKQFWLAMAVEQGIPDQFDRAVVNDSQVLVLVIAVKIADICTGISPGIDRLPSLFNSASPGFTVDAGGT